MTLVSEAGLVPETLRLFNAKPVWAGADGPVVDSGYRIMNSERGSAPDRPVWVLALK